MFGIEESVMRQTMQWTKKVAGLDVEHLRELPVEQFWMK